MLKHWPQKRGREDGAVSSFLLERDDGILQFLYRGTDLVQSVWGCLAHSFCQSLLMQLFRRVFKSERGPLL